VAVPGQQPYEIELDTFGFRLADAELVGGHQHRVEPIPPLAPQISSTAEMQYSDINRQAEVAFAQDDFSEGLATKLKFHLETQKRIRWAKGADTSFAPHVIAQPKITTLGAPIAEEPSLHVQRGSVTYVAAATKLYQVTTAGPVLDTNFAATITALLVWGGSLIVGQGSSANFQHRASDASGGAFTAATVPAHFLAAINDQLYRAVQPATLAIADQVAGPWADFDVGDSSYNITGLATLDNLIVIGKEDGAYAFDQDLVAVPLVPELRLQADAQVCRAMATFNRDLFITGRYGMVRFRPGEGLKSVGLDTLADPALPGTPPDPRPRSFTSDGRYLYANVRSGAGVYVWKHDLAGNWHSCLYRPDLGESADLLSVTAKIGATAKNALLIAYKSGASWQLAYALWSRLLDPTKDTDYQYETTVASSFRTLDYTGNLPTVEKEGDRLKIVAGDVAGSRPIAAYAYVDDDASRKIADFQIARSHEERLLAEPENFHRVSLEFQLTPELATSPKLRAFHLSTAYLFRVVRRHTVHLLAASATPLATGGRAHARQNWLDVVDALRELRRTHVAVDVRDHVDRREFTAYLEDVREWKAQPRRATGGDSVAVVTVVLNEVAEESSSEE
jgi:hypothetical protein